MLQIKVKRLHPEAIMPAFKTLGNTGFDLYALASGRIDPPAITPLPTGIALEIPKGYALILMANSANGLKAGVTIAHGFGIIDSGQEGEIILAMCAQRPFKFFKGDKLAHGILIPVPEVQLISDDSRTAASPSTPSYFPEFHQRPLVA